MPIDASLLAILRCPKSHTDLRLASQEEADRLYVRWARVSPAVIPTGFLISADGSWAYAERDGVPCLLVDEAIAL